MNARLESPAAIEFEKLLLGTLILEPQHLDEAADLCPAEAFYRPDHGRLLTLLLSMRARKVPIDEATVPDAALAADREHDGQAFGGYGYVLQLPQSVPSRVNWRHYAREVRDRWMRRLAIETASALDTAARDLSRPLDEVHATAKQAADRLAGTGDAGSFVRLHDGAEQAAKHAQRVCRGEAAYLGAPMPLASLAEVVPVLEYGEVVLIAARPAMGKSALARVIAEGVAGWMPEDDGRSRAVGLFSFEMDARQIATLSLAAAANLDSRDLRDGRIDDEAWDAIEAGRGDLARLPMYVYEGETPTVEALAARCASLARTAWSDGHRLRMVVVDYVQLMRASRGMEKANRNEQLSHISRGLKDLARSLGVVVLALSQLSRDVEKRADKTPQLSDLRDSGALEQDAAVVMFPFRPGVYSAEASPDEAVVFVRKNRYGPLGDRPLRWVGRQARFEDVGGSPRGFRL